MQIQWFFWTSANKWLPFCPLDNVAIENAFLDNKTGNGSRKVVLNGERLHEVDLEKRTMEPIYWKGTVIPIRRATWYVCDEKKCQPLEETLADKIEADFEENFTWIANKDSVETVVTQASVQKKGESILEKSTLNLDGELKNHQIVYQQGVLNKVFVLYLGNSAVEQVQNAIKSIYHSSKSDSKVRKDVWLVRGFEHTFGFEVAADPAPVPKINHLVLVVHGIGQKLSEKYDSFNFINDVSALRSIIRSCPTKAAGSASVQLLPICWRLEMDIPFKSKEADVKFEDVLSSIIVTNISALRTVTSDLVLDRNHPMILVLLYMTPSSGDVMVASVINELNRVYEKFKEYNPDFVQKGGKLSIVAHSLGTILMYDILYTKYDKLLFKVEKYFSLGSPIGLFLLLKGGQLDFDAISLKCQEFYNIFHPNDPIATRIEPVLDSRTRKLTPFPIPYSKGGFTKFTLSVSDNLAKISQSMQSLMSKQSAACQKSYDFSRLNSNGRLDYILRENFLENQYLSAIKAHTNYWNDPDVGLFILRILSGTWNISAKD